MAFEIRLLGAFEVLQDGCVVGPGPEAVKPRTLLALLALHANHVVTKTALIDRMWPDPPATAKNLVEKYVSQWRKVLEPERLETVGSGYRLRVGSAEFDLDRYRQRLDDGRSLGAAGDHESAAAVLHDAFGMWQAWDVATFAAELLPRSEAQHLVDLHLRGLEDWAGETLSAGSDDEVVEPLREAVDAHPYRERLAELLMWGYASRGEHNAAAEVYRQARRLLRDDLGQDPGDGLKQMHARVLRLDPALRPREHGRRVSNLPPRRLRFTGREQALRAVREALGSPGRRVPGVAVTGVVGVGKTALALEYARLHAQEYDVVWVVGAASRTSVAEGLEALAERLGCPFPADREAGLQAGLDQLWARLRETGRALLVVDDAGEPADLQDCWPPLDPPPTADGGHRADLIVTSLNPDWGRHLQTLELDVLSPPETAALLRDRGVRGSDVQIGELAWELDGLPLACEQAAAYLRQTGMPLDGYLPLFRARRSDLLERGAPDDHRGTIEATWRLALGQLADSPAAIQLALTCASLAPEEIPLDLLAADPSALPEPLRLCVDDELDREDAISEVRRFSLVTREGDRLRMHRLLQAVILDSLGAEQAAAWRARAVTLLVAAAPPPNPTAAPPPNPTAAPPPNPTAGPPPNPTAGTTTDPTAGTTTDRAPSQTPSGTTAGTSWPVWQYLTPHLTFLLPRLDTERVREPAVVDLVRRAGDYLVARGSLDDAATMLRFVLAAVEAAPDDRWQRHEPELGSAWTALGDILNRGGNAAEAVAAHQRALAVLCPRHPPEHPLVARAVAGLTEAFTCHHGVSLWRSEELGQVRERFTGVLDVLRDALGEDDPNVAHAISGLGQVLQDSGDVAAGVACQQQALEVLLAAYGPDHPDVGHVSGKLGFGLGLCREFELARRYQEESLRILRLTFGDAHPETGWPLSNLGVLCLDAGDVDQAIAFQEQALGVFATTPGQELAALIAGWRLARAQLAADRPEAALRALEDVVPELTEALGPGHADVAGATLDLARARDAASAAEQLAV